LNRFDLIVIGYGAITKSILKDSSALRKRILLISDREGLLLTKNIVQYSRRHIFESKGIICSDQIIVTLKVEESNIPVLFQMLNRFELSNLENIFFFSSVSVYGNSIEPANEFSETRPINAYGNNNLFLEKYLNRFSEKLTILRISNVIADFNLNDFLNTSLARIVRSRPVLLFNSGLIYRDFISMKDLTHVVIKLIDSKIEALPKVINISSNSSNSYLQIVDILRCELDLEITLESENLDVSKIIENSFIDNRLLMTLVSHRMSQIDDYLPAYLAAFIERENCTT
jgi:nucleoside-diphosphate-sugar epimerase